jgi:hypothetical protein
VVTGFGTHACQSLPLQCHPADMAVHQPQRIYIFFASLFDTGIDGTVL